MLTEQESSTSRRISTGRREACQKYTKLVILVAAGLLAAAAAAEAQEKKMEAPKPGPE